MMKGRTPFKDRFRDKVAVVTGGSSGIGRAIVEELCKEGAAVAFTGISDAGVERLPSAPAQQEDRREDGRVTTLAGRYCRTVARLIAEVAEAQTHARAEGAVHRDIKPHNLIVTPQGCLMITDFGFVRFVGDEDDDVRPIRRHPGLACQGL
jgi:NAD(P)-dependent dehydrogenase (short-subunit alcohol dehydrogenase family)